MPNGMEGAREKEAPTREVDTPEVDYRQRWKVCKNRSDKRRRGREQKEYREKTKRPKEHLQRVIERLERELRWELE